MRGKLKLELRDASSRLVAARRAHNTVMQSGAELIAELFSGGGGPITHMGVGKSDSAPDDVAVAALVNTDLGDEPPLAGETAAPIQAAAFSSEIDPVHRLVRVRVRATLPAVAAVGRIREAGLISRSGGGDGDEPADRLYNRVTFAPIDKGDDHELTLFWEVEFPFGDLQWLS